QPEPAGTGTEDLVWPEPPEDWMDAIWAPRPSPGGALFPEYPARRVRAPRRAPSANWDSPVTRSGLARARARGSGSQSRQVHRTPGGIPMSHDGLPVRAGDGARAARADRRASSGRTSTRRHLAIAAEALAIVALVAAACNASTSGSAGVAGATATPESASASVEPSIEASVAPSAPA